MNRNSLSIWNLVLFIGLLVFSGLFWLNSHVGYEAKSAFLVSAKDGKQDDVLADTVASFALTDTFVQRTMSSTRLQEGLSFLMSEEQFQVVEDTNVRGGHKGGLVLVKSSNLDAETAELVSQESTETLLRMSRLYIGDEKVFTVQVIDRAIVTKGIIYPCLYALKTFLTALGIFLILILIDPFFGWVRSKAGALLSKKKGHEEDVAQHFVPQKLDPAFFYPTPEVEVAPQPKATEVINSEVFGSVKEENPLQSVSVSMEDLPFTFETPEPEASMEVTPEAHPVETVELAPDKEPSVLEYKRRLNELLSQK